MPDTADLASSTMTTRLLAAILVKGMSRDDGMLRLAQVGLPNADIGTVFGVSESTVRGVIFRNKGKAAKNAD